MSVKKVSSKGGGMSAEGLEAFRASIMSEVEAKTEETEETIITNIRGNLVSTPVAGEEWDEQKSYIVGDIVTFGGVSYTATKYSLGKSPEKFDNKWTPTPTEETVPAWDDIPEGSVVEEGQKVTYNKATWVCVSQHIKSNVYKPKSNSTKWQEAA